MRPNTPVFSCLSLSACKKKKVGIQPFGSEFSKGSLCSLSSRSDKTKRFEPVSPSTHTHRGIENKTCIFAAKPRAEGDMLPEFKKYENKNKCCTIAARQTAEGDMFKKSHKMPTHELHFPSSTAGGSARPFSGRPHGARDDVINVRQQRGGSVWGPSLCPHSQLARMRGSSVGFSNSFTGIQTTICHKTASFQRGNYVCGRGRIGPGFDGRNRNPSEQTGNQSGARGGEPSGFLLPLFRSSKERRLSPPPYFGSTHIKHAPKKVLIQNVDTQGTLSIDSPKRLVCDNRPGRRILSHRHLPLSQEIPQVCIPGHSIRISNYTVRAIFSSEGFYQMCGGSSVPAEGQGNKNIVLHRRLSDMLVIKGASHKGRRDGPESPQRFGFQNKHDKEPVSALSANGISGAQFKLPIVSSHIDGRENSVFHTMSRPFSEGKSGSVQAVLANVGAYGFSDRRGTFGASQNEGFPALDRAFTSVLSPASQPTSENRSYVRRSAQTLGEPYDAQDGDSPRGGVVQGNHDDRRIVKGLGSNLNGQSGERRVAATADAQTHKLFGAISSVVSTETLSEFPQRSACFSENRQLHSGCLHQPTGGHTLSSTASVGRETDRVERHTTSISQSNPRSGGFKQGGRFTVQGKPSLRGVETPSSGGEPVMAEVRSGCRRSLRLARKRSMPSVLLSGGRKCTAGCGCSSPPMAKCASVCVSPSKLNLPHSSQSEGTMSVTNSDSPALAISTLGGRDSSTLVRSAVAPPPTEGPPVSGGGGNLPSSSRHVSPLGLARERWNLNAAGLPSSVINTIQSARASSTRTLYGNKWRVFEGWCERRVVIPFQCSVKDILCFLQDLLDKGKAFSTIKVYLAAISACHIGFGEKSAGQHPLISRFMKGARRIRPVSKQMVPLWDLPIVLEALSQHPFEPIEAVSLKYLSLKTALLLALVTAKRVSDLHALSVSPSCLQFAPGLTKVSFRPNPAFVPKVMESAYRCPATELAAFHPPPFSSPEDQKLNALCPVRALQVYVERTAGFRTCDQLFVSWATPHIGKPLSRQRLSHWIVEAISVAYSSRGLQPPRGLRAHSTRGMATSWALFRGVSVQDICSAASWATPHTFVRFYRLDVSEPSLAHAVLGAGNSIPILR